MMITNNYRRSMYLCEESTVGDENYVSGEIYHGALD
jgi:hypothetical protein